MTTKNKVRDLPVFSGLLLLLVFSTYAQFAIAGFYDSEEAGAPTPAFIQPLGNGLQGYEMSARLAERQIELREQRAAQLKEVKKGKLLEDRAEFEKNNGWAMPKK